jgi:quinol monooxygenase YgiN
MLQAVIVTIDVKPEFRERFIEESRLDAEGSVGNEPGCARFDVIQDRTDPNRFYPWFARPFTLASGSTLYPPDDAW